MMGKKFGPGAITPLRAPLDTRREGFGRRTAGEEKGETPSDDDGYAPIRG